MENGKCEKNKRKSKRLCCAFRRKKNRRESMEEDDIKEIIQQKLNAALPTTDSDKELQFNEKLPKLLEVGDVITIKGFILPNCVRFAVNLNCNNTPNTDVGYHFNPRFSPRYIARNAKIKGVWGDEESTSCAKFMLSRNTNITLEILITEDAFETFIDGCHFCGFAYRIPISSLNHVEVCGPVHIRELKFRKVNCFPDSEVHNGATSLQVPVVKKGSCECNTDDVPEINVPYVATLPKGWHNQYRLKILGRTKMLPHVFYVNLQTGSSIWPHPHIPLHINPRFNTSNAENVLVRNSWENGQWGNEERSSTFPFSPGEKFVILIYKEADHYSIWINGVLNGEFKFRNLIDVDNVNTLYMQGDMVMYKAFLYKDTDDVMDVEH